MDLEIDFRKKADKVKLYNFLKAQNGRRWVSISNTTRTLNLNNYYWGIVIKIICDFTGYDDPVELHNYFCKKYLPDFERSYHEGFQFRKGSTRKLTNNEFWDYIIKIQAFAAEVLDIYIPDPNEIDSN